MRTYFPGLNAIRGYAALCVVVSHLIFSGHNWFGDPLVYPWMDFLIFSGGTAVTLFFVLSGFLITSLLLAEKQQTGGIDYRRFQVRRVLRIWPVYFFALAVVAVLALFAPGRVIPPLPAWTLATLPVFLSEVPRALGGEMGVAGHLWTIAVETKFYLIWPLLMKPRRVLRMMVSVVVLRWLITLMALALIRARLDPFGLYQALLNLFYQLRFDCLAIGGIAAYLLHSGQHRFLLKRPVFALTLAVVAIVIFLPFYESDTFNTLISLVFAGLIVNVASGRGRRWLELPGLTRLGELSYSLYLIHFPVLWLVRAALYSVRFDQMPAYDAVLVAATFGLSLLAAALMRRCVEQPFLRLKGISNLTVPEQNRSMSPSVSPSQSESSERRSRLSSGLENNNKKRDKLEHI